MVKFPQSRAVDDAGLPVHVLQCEKRRTVSAHQRGELRTDDIRADFLLKCPQNAVVEEGSALRHDVLAETFGVRATDDLVERVFHHADRKPGGDVFNRRAVLLRLLDRAVHKDRATRTEIHGRVGKQTELCELLGRVTERRRKSLEERAAPRGTGLVEVERVDRAVADVEALDVLPADVEDEIHVGAELFRRREVRNGFHNAEVCAEGVADDLLTVARDRRARDGQIGIGGVNPLQIIPDQRDGVAVVGGIERLADVAVAVAEHQLDGC